MIEILDIKDEKILGFRVDGKMDKSDLQEVFDSFEKRASGNDKIQLYAEIENFHMGDFSAELLKDDIKFWLKHPGIIPNVEKVALVTDSKWVEKAFYIECALIPTLEGECFSPEEKAEAMLWLKTDQRAKSRMDLTFGELAETSTLKFAGGFAIGLLTAGLFSEKQRRNIGTAVMFGTVLAGIPLGIKVLNNNRQLLGD
ncbi:MAG: STAS/SEC14 domain-containing protein [Pyrinomonadaceae bacterium]|nr:STAS/SEC14 domain-containing protein [Pyrinomonadaceae bacterium]